MVYNILLAHPPSAYKPLAEDPISESLRAPLLQFLQKDNNLVILANPKKREIE